MYFDLCALHQGLDLPWMGSITKQKSILCWLPVGRKSTTVCIISSVKRQVVPFIFPFKHHPTKNNPVREIKLETPIVFRLSLHIGPPNIAQTALKSFQKNGHRGCFVFSRLRSLAHHRRKPGTRLLRLLRRPYFWGRTCRFHRGLQSHC